MDDPGQQTISHGPVALEVNPNQHKGASRIIAIAALMVICLSGFSIAFFLR
jgi:flagellar basal body-associated protein FliL